MQTTADITRLNQLDRNRYLEGHIASLQVFISGWTASVTANHKRVAPTLARLERAVERRAEIERAALQNPAQNPNMLKDAATEVANCTSLLGELADLNAGYTGRIDMANRNIDNFRAQIVD